MVRGQRGLGAGSAAARHDDAHVSCLHVAPGSSEAYGFPLRGETSCLCSNTPPALNTMLHTRNQVHAALCSCLLRDHRLKGYENHFNCSLLLQRKLEAEAVVVCKDLFVGMRTSRTGRGNSG